MRPALLALNQYYWPGVEADGRLLTELCEGLAASWDVTVVTGAPPRGPAGRFERNGVTVVRVPSTAFGRHRLTSRALNYATYFLLAALRTARMRRPDVVLCFTNPPFVGDLAWAAAKRFRAPLVAVVQDVFPETAAVLGRVGSGPLLRVLGGLVGFYLRRADRVVAVGDRMAGRLEAKGVRRERIRVIENWVDTDAIRPVARPTRWAERHGLAGRFVVMHSGNVGYAQDLDTLVEAAFRLAEVERLATVVIGQGARLAAVEELAARLGAPVRFLPYQPAELLSESLSSADVHVVGLARGLAGYVVPSRLYGVLAAGRPVIAAADDDAETAQLVRSVGCGVVVPPGRPDALAETIRAAHDGQYDLDAMGRRGRQYALSRAHRPLVLERYRDLLDEILRRQS
jgi:glycosyltransferase involved in cell wall biosynthesis